MNERNKNQLKRKKKQTQNGDSETERPIYADRRRNAICCDCRFGWLVAVVCRIRPFSKWQNKTSVSFCICSYQYCWRWQYLRMLNIRHRFPQIKRLSIGSWVHFDWNWIVCVYALWKGTSKCRSFFDYGQTPQSTLHTTQSKATPGFGTSVWRSVFMCVYVKYQVTVCDDASLFTLFSCGYWGISEKEADSIKSYISIYTAHTIHTQQTDRLI